MDQHKFDKSEWEQSGVIVDAGGGARYIGLLSPDCIAEHPDAEEALFASMKDGFFDLHSAVSMSYFEMPVMAQQGLQGVQRSADLAGVYMAHAPARVLVRANAAVLLSWLDADTRTTWIKLVENLFGQMQKARATQGAGLVLPGPGLKIPPYQGGRS